jgi:RHS repeat-associated protein
LYIDGFEYKNDLLQFISHENGRIRYTPVIGAAAAKLDYDYFIKDNLGDVRMVLTEQQQQDIYPAATLEGGVANSGDAVYVESQYYTINAANIVAKSVATGIADYQNNNGNPPYNTNPNSNAAANSQNLYRLIASPTAGVTGLGMTLKVMSGDVLNIFGKSYYFQNTTGTDNKSIPVIDIFSGLLGAPSGAAGNKSVSAAGLNAATAIYDAVNGFLGNPVRGTGTTPKAYINWILFDENFKFVSGNFSRVGAANTVKNHYADPAMQNIQATKNGYIYIYVSNESPVNVFFDNLQVIHNHSQMLEETHYYPFGLTMSGISSKRISSLENKKNKFQNQEFNDDLGVDYYEFRYRNHDPQIGRFIENDPLSDKYPFNSPYSFSENRVTSGYELEGLEFAPGVYPSSGNTKSVANLFEKESAQTPNAQIANETKAENAQNAKAVPLMVALYLEPQYSIPFMVSFLSGVPVTPAPQAMSGVAAPVATAMESAVPEMTPAESLALRSRVFEAGGEIGMMEGSATLAVDSRTNFFNIQFGQGEQAGIVTGDISINNGAIQFGNIEITNTQGGLGSIQFQNTIGTKVFLQLQRELIDLSRAAGYNKATIEYSRLRPPGSNLPDSETRIIVLYDDTQ